MRIRFCFKEIFCSDSSPKFNISHRTGICGSESKKVGASGVGPPERFGQNGGDSLGCERIRKGSKHSFFG